MANVLSEEMGFEVITVKNGKKKEIRSALNRFDNQNRNIDKTRYNVVALFYYSGHGMRVNNINYIIPTDAYIQSPADLEEFAINSDWIVGRMEAQNNFLSLLMFDACRDNPLTKSMANYYKSINPTKSADYQPDRFAGFDKKELNGTGVFISYAAKAGETAGSGDLGGSTSPYISAYLTHVRTPNLLIETLFKKVGGEVVEKTKGTQHPTTKYLFFDDFYFKTATPKPKDSDGDGYPDNIDPCPNTYWTTNNGCPPAEDKNLPAEDKNLPALAYVQGGSFQMGSNDNDDEKPIHTVNVNSFYMGKYEVTNAEFAAFLNAKGNQEEGGRNWAHVDSDFGIKESNGIFTVKKGMEKHPVTQVSWYGAKAYCKWLSETTGQTYRLPTEAEWEYAARGGNKSNGYTYSGSNRIDEVAWYYKNSYDLGTSHPNYGTNSVGTKKANELGIYDMSGNVWEWCEDTWHESYLGAPGNGTAWLTGGNDSRRVLRGGSWSSYDSTSRVAYRLRSTPANRSSNGGFRLARGI